jgi:hypothetical protein
MYDYLPPVYRTQDILLRAKNYIGVMGWTQRRMQDDNGFCLVGALMAAGNQRQDMALEDAGKAVAQAIAETGTYPHPRNFYPIDSPYCDWQTHYIININDQYLRSKAEAIEILDRAIRLTTGMSWDNGMIGKPERIIKSVPEKTPVKTPVAPTPEKVPAKVLVNA